jgi:hypothetical protein
MGDDMASPTMTPIDSSSASALHERLQQATRAAREAPAPDVGPAVRARRPPAATAWSLLHSMPLRSGSTSWSRAEQERAVRLVLSGLIEGGGANDVPCALDEVRGPVLIVRSGPWAVLRSLLDALAPQPNARPISIVCHTRDAETLARLAEATGQELAPIFYPRFEPFVTATLRRVLADGTWTTAIVLDGSKHGRGLSLEHVTTALDAPARYVWNASHAAFRLRSLRERLGREQYALVRGLLRWHAAQVR